MRAIMADNDIQGHMSVLTQLLQGEPWRDSGLASIFLFAPSLTCPLLRTSRMQFYGTLARRNKLS
jgi:hypothetical protein